MVWSRQSCLAGSQASQDTEITSANITVLRLTLTFCPPSPLLCVHVKKLRAQQLVKYREDQLWQLCLVELHGAPELS